MEVQAQQEYQKMAQLRQRARNATRALDQARRKVGAANAGAALAAAAVRSALGALDRAGEFSDPRAANVADNFMPWLLSRVEDRVAKDEVANTCRDGTCTPCEREVARGSLFTVRTSLRVVLGGCRGDSVGSAPGRRFEISGVGTAGGRRRREGAAGG